MSKESRARQKTKISRDELRNQRQASRMVGVWDKADQKFAKFSDGNHYAADKETGAIRRLTPKSANSKAEVKALRRKWRQEREAAAQVQAG